MNQKTIITEEVSAHDVSEIKTTLRFKSQLIHTSRKKLIFVTRYIQYKTLKQAYMFFYCLNKRYAKPILSFISNTIKNVIYRTGITQEEAEAKTIRFIVLEKTSNKTYGLRYAAKGRAFRAVRVSTRLNMYIN